VQSGQSTTHFVQLSHTSTQDEMCHYHQNTQPETRATMKKKQATERLPQTRCCLSISQTHATTTVQMQQQKKKQQRRCDRHLLCSILFLLWLSHYSSYGIAATCVVINLRLANTAVVLFATIPSANSCTCCGWHPRGRSTLREMCSMNAACPSAFAPTSRWFAISCKSWYVAASETFIFDPTTSRNIAGNTVVLRYSPKPGKWA